MAMARRRWTRRRSSSWSTRSISDAVRKGASDIHIEPYEKVDARALPHRRRAAGDDGAARSSSRPRSSRASKIMAELDIAERRVPAGRPHQDQGASTAPSTCACLVAPPDDLRREDRHANPRQDQPQHRPREARIRAALDEGILLAAIANPYGMVLVTGPTGSGKTTTLYSALSRVNTPEVNVLTAEDPVGVQPGRHQPGAGERGRRACRSPPRSRRSCARTPTSSWSAKSATSRRRRSRSRRRSPATSCSPPCTPTTPPSAIGRLIDMGIEPFLVASSVNLVLRPAARARACAAPASSTIELDRRGAARAAADAGGRGASATFMRGRGAACDCNNTGYRGRQGVYEVMPITPQDPRPGPGPRVRPPRSRQAAIEEGMLTLPTGRAQKLKRGRHDRGRSAQGDRGGRSCRPRGRQPTRRRHRGDAAAAARGHGRQKGRPTCTSRPECRPSSGSTGRSRPSEYEVLTPESLRPARLQRALGRAAQALRDHQGAGLLVRDQGPVALPRQRLPAARRASRWRSARFRTRSCRSRSSGCRRWCRTSRNRHKGLVLRDRARPAAASRRRSPRCSTRSTPRARRHIMTIEDPIEYIHHHKKCIVNQREVGADTDVVPDGAQVRAAPGPGHHPDRRDARPRDHRGGAHHRRDRSPGVRHPAHQLDLRGGQPHRGRVPVRPAAPDPARQLAFALEGVDDPAADSRAAAAPAGSWCAEVLVCTPAIRAVIREGKTHQIYSLMQAGQKYGDADDEPGAAAGGARIDS